MCSRQYRRGACYPSRCPAPAVPGSCAPRKHRAWRDCPEALGRAGSCRGSGCSGAVPLHPLVPLYLRVAFSKVLWASVSLRPEVTLRALSFPIRPVNPQGEPLYKHSVLLAEP